MPKEGSFSEAAYLACYPDVAAAVAAGQFQSGEQHFELWGRREGRQPWPKTDRIHIDEPNDLSKVGGCQVFQGWTTSLNPEDRISVSLNGEKVKSVEIPRPDVERQFPHLNAKGWMFFFEPAENERDYVLSLRIADVTSDLRFTVSPDAVQLADIARKIRRKHLDFLKSALACAMCHASCPEPSMLIGSEWRCPRCGERYDCTSSINFIPKSYPNYDAIKFKGAIYSHGYDATAEDLIAEVTQRGGKVLDCGAGWRHSVRESVITTEILHYPSTDVVAVGEHLPFRDGAFDAVLSLHVLEHVRNPFVCAAELMRVLKPGGRFLAVIPYIAPVHGAPFHFFNPTPQGLLTLFENFSTEAEVSVPRSAHPLAALKELLNAYSGFFEERAWKLLANEKIGDFAARTTDDILKSSFAAGFRQDGMMHLSGNYMIAGKRR